MVYRTSSDLTHMVLLLVGDLNFCLFEFVKCVSYVEYLISFLLDNQYLQKHNELTVATRGEAIASPSICGLLILLYYGIIIAILDMVISSDNVA